MEINKVIMDSDPGHDDAIAILLASSMPQIQLLGISTASGNQSIEKTTRNALSICDYLHIDVPVAKGESRPLYKEPLYCPEIHGDSGLDGFDYPPEDKQIDDRPGYQLIIDLCLANDRVVITPTGPLTNVAKALVTCPAIKEHIEKIVLMGGSIGTGNTTPFAEFNIFVDPEAADIVFHSGLPVYMCGLDVTRQVLTKRVIVDEMKSVGGVGAKMFADLMETYNQNQKNHFGWQDGAPLHDPVTIVSLIDKSVVTFEPMDVEIDLSKGERYGRTECTPNKNSKIYCATRIDVAAYWKIIKQALENCR